MKVVLFCGGLGTRLRDYSDTIPKPMVPIGYRPILWHVMKYYAHFGHKEFILCLGYRADVIKSYFRSYDESISNDFVLSRGGADIRLLASDIEDWTITLIDTGPTASIGERLLAVREHVANDGPFLANYADGLTDLDLNAYIARSVATDNVATFMAVRPSLTFHLTDIAADGAVRTIKPVEESDFWINGGYFVLQPRDLRLHATGRGPGPRALQPTHRCRSPGRRAPQRLLDGDGHLQGQGAARRALRDGTRAVGALEGRTAMKPIGWSLISGASTILAIGAHADDIEIGCGGTLLRIAEESSATFRFVILSASPERADEARASAQQLLGDRVEVEVADFRDGYLPYAGAPLKERFDEMGRRAIAPDVVFTAYRDDRHQDHRLVSELTWNTFRDHLILEYEIPKFDGDLGSPSAFVELARPTLDRKLAHLRGAFPSQASKPWFNDETFLALARLRGIECRADSGHAEAFYVRKLRLA